MGWRGWGVVRLGQDKAGSTSRKPSQGWGRRLALPSHRLSSGPAKGPVCKSRRVSATMFPKQNPKP
eukprot:1177495-Prorocentrum_minimum.AAC.5